jgi:hypothetical protein
MDLRQLIGAIPPILNKQRYHARLRAGVSEREFVLTAGEEVIRADPGW